MTRPVVRAVLFDLDDTLFDRAAALRRWTVSNQVGEVDAEGFAWITELDQRRPASAAAFRGGDDRAVRYPAHGGRAGRGVPERASRRGSSRSLGVRPAIERLAAGARIAVVTNGGAAQRDKLAACGSRARDPRRVRVEVRAPASQKPALAIFEACARVGRCSAASECVFVGDDPIDDIAGAAALGMATCVAAARTVARDARDVCRRTRSRALVRFVAPGSSSPCSTVPAPGRLERRA